MLQLWIIIIVNVLQLYTLCDWDEIKHVSTDVIKSTCYALIMLFKKKIKTKFLWIGTSAE